MADSPDPGGSEAIERPAPTVMPFKPFPVNLLPGPLGRFVVLSAESKCCDPSFVALPLLSALGAAIGNSRVIQLKPDWTEPSVIWTAIVGESGDGKSPALESVLQFLRKPEAKAAKEYEEAYKEYEQKLARFKVAKKEWEKAQSDDAPPVPPKKPTRRRFLVGDTTIEGLASLLQQNPRGLLTANDELSGWFNGFGQYRSSGRGSEEAHWLEMYGARPVTFDRKDQERSVYVEQAHVCVTGGTQPGPLRRLLNQERVEEGMAARFLMTMPPRRVTSWTDVAVEQDLEYQVQEVFDRALALRGEKDASGSYQPRRLLLNSEAQALFVEYFNTTNVELAELTGALAAAWSKLKSIPARVALVLHLAMESPAPEIGTVAMQNAIEMTAWFKYELKRIYSFLAETEDQARVRSALEFAQRQDGPFAVRDLYRAQPGLYPQADLAREAFEVLVAEGHGTLERQSSGAKGGRPSLVFTLMTIDRTANTPGGVGSVGCVNPSLPIPPASSDADGSDPGAVRSCEEEP